MDRRAVVAEAQRTAAEPRGCKGLVWKRHWHWSHLSSDGREAGRRFPRRPSAGEFSVVSPRSEMYAAGSREEKRAGGPLPRGTIAQSFLFCNGGEGSPWTEGLVAACALLQGRVRFGLRRYPARSALRRFPEQGDSPCTPGGGCAPCTPLGTRMVLLWPAPSFRGGTGLACAAIPPAPPSDVFQNRGTPPVPPAGAAPPAPRLGHGWSCCGLRPPSGEGPVWPAPLSRPLHPPTFSRTGGHAVPPAGAAPPAPCLGGGREVAHRDAGHDCASVALSRDYTTIATHATQSKVSFFSRGFGLACAAIPPAPPSDVFQNRGTRCTPGGGCAPCTLPGRMERRRFLHLPRQLLAEVPKALGDGDVLGLRR